MALKNERSAVDTMTQTADFLKFAWFAQAIGSRDTHGLDDTPKTRPRQLDDDGPLRDAQLEPCGQSVMSYERESRICERDVAWKVDRLVS